MRPSKSSWGSAEEGEADLGILTGDWGQSSKPRSQALLPKGGPPGFLLHLFPSGLSAQEWRSWWRLVVVIYWFYLQHSFLLLWQQFLDLSLQEHPLLHWLHSMWTSRSSTAPSMGWAWDPSWAILTIWILVRGAKDWKQKQHLEKKNLFFSSCYLNPQSCLLLCFLQTWFFSSSFNFLSCPISLK